MKVTMADVRKTLGHLAEYLPGIELETWSPGDRYGTRYRVEGPGGTTPLGNRYWLGRTQCYEGLWTAIHAIREYRHQRAVERAS